MNRRRDVFRRNFGAPFFGSASSVTSRDGQKVMAPGIKGPRGRRLRRSGRLSQLEINLPKAIEALVP